MRSFDEIMASARDKPAFSNSTEGEYWTGAWCARCKVEDPHRNGLKGNDMGCPLLCASLLGKTPVEWLEQPWGESGPSLTDRYHCIEFRPRGGGGGGEPRPKPEPPDMDGLFPRPERAVRMLVQPELQAGRRVLEPST
jgi:hypothetical protein